MAFGNQEKSIELNNLEYGELELSPAEYVMGSRNSNRYVHIGGRFGCHVQALPSGEREAYGTPSLVPTFLTGFNGRCTHGSDAGDFFGEREGPKLNGR